MNNYVLLTGSKNNAGDFLIKYRAKKLFSEIRKDREVIDVNGWKPITQEKLEVINQSKALILMGGPSLVSDMRPRVFALPDDLNKIKVPITIMGSGWKSISGRYSDCYSYQFSKKTKELLDRVASDNQIISVRDYQAMHVLAKEGYQNVLMTGCPAYYDWQGMKAEPNRNIRVKNVAFSLGVSHVESAKMDKLVKEQILAFRDKFLDASFQVVFHHSLDEKLEKEAYGSLSKRFIKDRQFAAWLETNSIRYVDISGSAENLINYYAGQDLHVGYRVHAHIFMNSINKLSYLFNEDSRGKGSYDAIGGLVVNSYESYRAPFIKKVLKRLGVPVSYFTPNWSSTRQALDRLDYEQNTSYPVLFQTRVRINQNFQLMDKYIKQLP